MPRKVQPAGFVIDLENGDIITALIAAIEKMAGRIEAEAAWIVTACPFIGDMLQRAVSLDRKDSDAVVKPIACIDESAIV